MGVGKGRSGRDVGREQADAALVWTARIGWITPSLLATLLWPGQSETIGRKSAEKLLRRLLAAGLLIRRPLRQGSTYVLSSAGAYEATMALHDDVATGKDWGRMINGLWFPPLSFSHDLRAAQFLIQWLIKNEAAGGRVAFEAEARRQKLAKVPDGVLMLKGRAWLVEVEGSRKKGQPLRDLLQQLEEAASGSLRWRWGEEEIPVSGSVLVIPASPIDPRGYLIDHPAALSAAARRAGKKIPVLLSHETSPGTFTPLAKVVLGAED